MAFGDSISLGNPQVLTDAFPARCVEGLIGSSNTKNQMIRFPNRMPWVSLATLVIGLMIPVAGVCEELDWTKLRKEAPPALLEMAETKRDALILISWSPGKGAKGKELAFLGFFISRDGLVLCPLDPLCGGAAPEFMMAGGVRLKPPVVLGIFEEEGLALVKFEHKPEVVLTLSDKLAPLGSWVAFIAPSFVPKLGAGPILAHRRTSFVSKLKVQRKPIKNLSIAMPGSHVKAGRTIMGAPVTDVEGEVVAIYSFAVDMPSQTFVLARPAAGLSTRVAAAVGKDMRIKVPIPIEDQPFDPVTYTEEYHDACNAEAKEDYNMARKHAMAAVAKFPESRYAKLWEYMMVQRFELEPKLHTELLKGLSVPDDAPAWQRGMYFFQLGDVAMRVEGEDEKAIAYLKKSDELYPEGMACASLSWLFSRTGKREQAEIHARRAVAYEPDRIAYWDDLQKILYARGKTDEADSLRDRIFLLEDLY